MTNYYIQQTLEEDAIMEIKQTFMLSPADHSETIFRTAHFLKPVANSIHELTYNHFNLNHHHLLLFLNQRKSL
jgi:hypothetical protein